MYLDKVILTLLPWFGPSSVSVKPFKTEGGSPAEVGKWT